MLRLIYRGCRLRCPVCGIGRIFRGYFLMHEHCGRCGLKYQRDPGYFLGSIYFNYGVTALIVAIGYPVLVFGFGLPTDTMLWAGLLLCLVFPLWFHRYARSLWLAFDQLFDPRSPSDGTGGHSI